MTTSALRREGQSAYLVADDDRDLAVWINIASLLISPVMRIEPALSLVPTRNPMPLDGGIRQQMAVKWATEALATAPDEPDEEAVAAFLAEIRTGPLPEPELGDDWMATLTAIERLVGTDIADALERGHSCWTVITGDRTGYVQWLAEPDGELTVECASEHSTRALAGLADRYPHLRRLGWLDPEPPTRPNWRRDLGPDMHSRPQMTAELCVRTLLESYDMTPAGLLVDTWGGAPHRPLLTGEADDKHGTPQR